MKNPFRTFTTGTPLEVEELEGEFIGREMWAITKRQLHAAIGLAVLFVILAAAINTISAAEPTRPLLTLGLVLALAIASAVTFDVSVVTTAPTLLISIPMWFLLPPGILPIAVCAGHLVGRLPSVLGGRTHPTRLLLCVGSSIHSFGPALVLLATHTHSASLSRIWVVVSALLAQSLFDFTVVTIYNRIAHGVGPGTIVHSLVWIHAVDALLAPVGFAIAIASQHEPWAFVLGISLVALFATFAQERRERIRKTAELSSAYRGTAMLLGDVVEADDAYTGEHSKGVVELSLAVADAMGLNAKQRRNVEFGALLHDVGKVTISKEIINKPGPLTPEEREIINTHTIEGQRMLDRIGGVLGEVGLVVRASHEDFDGTGYPDGLAGDAIPVEARIVSCCDAYSAMTTNRSYRAARTTDEAFAELRRCSGTQFDPAVVETLIDVLSVPLHADMPELAHGVNLPERPAVGTR